MVSIITIYDIIAKISIYVHNSGIEYDIISDYICCGNLDMIDNELMEIYNRIDCKRCSKLTLSDNYDWLLKDIKEFIDQNKILNLVHLLRYLDSLIGYDKSIYIFDDEGIISPLNSLFLDKIIVMPRIARTQSWKYSTDELSATLNTVLDFLLIVFKDDLYGYNIINYYVDLEYYQGEFKIAGAPVSDKTHLLISEFCDSNFINKLTFDVSYDNQETFLNRMIEIINYADEQKVVLIAFPELISSLSLNKMLLEKIDSCRFNSIKFIALPTYYDDKNKSNVGGVYYIDEKRIIFDQNKTFPYIKYQNHQPGKKEYVEKNKEVHVLNIKGVGRIIFPICKDLLVEKYADLCKAIRANLVIDRSFSPGKYGHVYFSRIIKGYTSFECCGFWINSCSYKTQDNKEKIICIAAHSKDDLNNVKSIFHCSDDCSRCICTFVVN